MVPFHDNEPRELVIALSVDSEGAWPFEGAVFSSEMWLQVPGGRGALVDVPAEEFLPSNDEFFNVDRAGERAEALTVVGLSSDGRAISLILPFGRTKDGIRYGSLIEEHSLESVPAFLRPIWNRWPEATWPRPGRPEPSPTQPQV